MADVAITLSLSRRSGMLAAAVSAVSRAGLNFKKHRYIDVDEGHRIELSADSEQEFGDPRSLIDELSDIRGVATVEDVVVDGRSLLHVEPEPVPEVELEPQPEGVTAPDEAPVPEVSGDADPVEAASQSPTAEPDMFTGADFEPDASSRYESGWDQATADDDTPREEAGVSSLSPSESNPGDQTGRSRLLMMRRRRMRR